jgi:hypothetical protein
MDIIYDLDGTVVCSKHRYRSLENGGIDLPFWIKSNTRANCFKDSLLPAIRTMRRDYNDGHNIIVCTARVLSEHDYQFFDVMNIPFHVMLSRPIGNTQNDADLKEWHLRRYASEKNVSWAKFCLTATFFEDAKIVLDRMDKIGIPTIDANEWNAMLRMVA